MKMINGGCFLQTFKGNILTIFVKKLNYSHKNTFNSPSRDSISIEFKAGPGFYEFERSYERKDCILWCKNWDSI